jgi:hypothetical protein
MPSSLSAKPAERSRAVWEGENTDLNSSIPQCRFSISTAGEISYHPDVLPRPSSSLSEPPAEVQQHELAPPTPRFSITPSLSSSRVERLVRERQLRKSGSCYTLVDEFEGKVEASMGSIGGGGGCERGLLLGQGAAGGAAEHSQETMGTTGVNVKDSN